jgi:hypothetical protein
MAAITGISGLIPRIRIIAGNEINYRILIFPLAITEFAEMRQEVIIGVVVSG